MIQFTTWMNLEHSMLSERSQALKATYTEVPNRQVYRDRKQLSVSQGPGARRMGSDS